MFSLQPVNNVYVGPVATAGRVMRSRGKLAQVSTGLGNLAFFGTRSRRAGLPFFELLLVLDPF